MHGISKESPRAKLVRAIIDRYNTTRTSEDYLNFVIWHPKVQRAFDEVERAQVDNFKQAIYDQLK